MANQLKISTFDIEKFVKNNEVQEITNPIFFNRNNSPTSDGLLSNEIFGITKEIRGGTFGYINLHDYFIDPLIYKTWCRIDSKVKAVVHGTKNFKIGSDGSFVEDENGSNGVKFIKDNIDKIKFRTTDSNMRDNKIEFIKSNKNNMFIKKYIVIPAYYRDIDTSNGYIAIGEINKLYANLLVSVRSLSETAEYGLNLSSATRGRIQETLVQIYNWFGAGTTIDGVATSPILPSKKGLIRQTVMRKSTDYGSRLVLSAPNLRVERPEDLMTDINVSLVPLASVIVNFYPFILFNTRRFFEETFEGGSTIEKYNKKTKQVEYTRIKNWQDEFSDDRIKKEMDRFIHGYSNRFIPIEVTATDDVKFNLKFKGENITLHDYSTNTMENFRDLTWCDIFYIVAMDVVKDKSILVTRYPIDTMYNQFPCKLTVSSTKETEVIRFKGKIYKNYPKIRQEDINKNTSNKFIDTMIIDNSYLKAICGDYDGDQVTIKGIYSVEANEELYEYMESKAKHINLGGTLNADVGNEAVQAIYSLTLVLSDTKLIDPVF